MIITLNHSGIAHTADLSSGINIWQQITNDGTPNAFHLPRASFVPFSAGSFVGSIEQGGSVQCEILTLAPHGNGTHTECVGHIAGHKYTIADCMQDVACIATLITVNTEIVGEAEIITLSTLSDAWHNSGTDALVIRTQSSHSGVSSGEWSGLNPPYMDVAAMQLIVDAGIRHVLIDLPSVDAEEDGGLLVSHHTFWQYPQAPRINCTITELIKVPQEVKDGDYLLVFNVSALASDAAPSRPILFPIRPTE